MSSDRVQVLDHPQALPGKCVICGYPGGIHGDGRKFVDFQFDIDFYGAVIFCTSCLTNCVNKLGFLSPEQTKELEGKLLKLEESLQRALTENARLRNALDSLDFLGSGNSSTVKSTPEKPSKPTKPEGSSNHGSPKSPDKRGSKDISETNSRDSEDPIFGL